MIRTAHPVGHAMVEAARGQGWRVTNPGEAEIARCLGLMGFTSADVESQFPIGPYRLDFALVADRIDVEADGWVHTAKSVRARDGLRDARLGAWGWTVIRIDADGDIGAQLQKRPELSADRAGRMTDRKSSGSGHA